jgi:hypothetical protein
MRTIIVECLLRQIVIGFDALVEAVLAMGGGPGGTGATKITSPDVSTYNDARGIAGDWSYNPTIAGGTMFWKVDSSPDTWVSWSVAQS